MKPLPTGVITPVRQRALKTQCISPVFLVTDVPRGLHPVFDGLTGSVKQRSRRDGDPAIASRALPYARS